MDVTKQEEVRGWGEKHRELAEKFFEVSKDYGKLEAELKILLTANYGWIREEKPNIGVESAIIRLCEKNEIARGIWKEVIEKESWLKGCAVWLDSLKSSTITELGIDKSDKEGERFGT